MPSRLETRTMGRSQGFSGFRLPVLRSGQWELTCVRRGKPPPAASVVQCGARQIALGMSCRVYVTFRLVPVMFDGLLIFVRLLTT